VLRFVILYLHTLSFKNPSIIYANTNIKVQLAHWMVSNILFGPSYKIIEGMTEAWCLANMIRLVGPLEKPVAPEYEEEFDIARGLANSTFTNPVTGLEEQYIKLGTVRQELEKVSGGKIEKGCIDFIESLLVVDHTKRPSAREALEHPWLRELGA
jgi:serine/threonine protein kinase